MNRHLPPIPTTNRDLRTNAAYFHIYMYVIVITRKQYYTNQHTTVNQRSPTQDGDIYIYKRPSSVWGFEIQKGLAVLTAPYGFDGRIAITNLNSPYGSTSQITGPLKASQTESGKYSFNTDLTAKDVTTTQNLPINLAPKTLLKTVGSFDLNKQRLIFQNFALTSGANRITGKGSLTTDAQNLDIQAKGTDYTLDKMPERFAVEAGGGRIEFVGDEKAHSSTALRQALRERGEI